MHLEYCKSPLIAVSISGPIKWTWIPNGSEWVYVIKNAGQTLVYRASHDVVYFANPSYSLDRHCPGNTVFMGQCVQDEGHEPRILIFDLLCENGVSSKGQTSHERYDRLMFLQRYFPSDFMVLQWCGELDALTHDFFKTLPHTVNARVGFGDEPGTLSILQLESQHLESS